MNRARFFASIPKDGLTLEIGALCSPLLHPARHNNRILDAFSREDLMRSYADDPMVKCEAILPVDYVWRGERLYSELIPEERFDAVISSHNIEHQPDLIGHLNSVTSVLKARGRVFLAIPDYRYCFDHFLSESTLSDVLGAHLEGRTRPSVTTILERHVLGAHNDSLRHWRGVHESNAALDGDVRAIRKAYDDLQAGMRDAPERYIDAHCWKFTPRSFRSILALLVAMGLVDLTVTSCLDTSFGSNEFYAVLQKNEKSE